MANNVDSPCIHRCDVKKVSSEWKKADCQRITWDFQVYAVENELKIEKRIAIWVRFDNGEPVWKRLCVIVCDLNWAAYCLDKNGQKTALSFSKADQEKLKVVDNKIIFSGGFLEVDDPGLRDILEPFDIPLEDTSESMVKTDCERFNYKTDNIKERDSRLFPWNIADCFEPVVKGDRDWLEAIPKEAEIHLRKEESREMIREGIEGINEEPDHLMPTGRNIHIEVVCREDEDNDWQPLFYFPQNDDSGNQRNLGVVFIGTSDEREIHWTISNQFLLSDKYELESGNNTHMISVSQDYNWLAAQLEGKEEMPFFEMMVDSIGLGFASKLSGHPAAVETLAKKTLALGTKKVTGADLPFDIEADHDFGTGPRTFWIGYVPADREFRAAGFPDETNWNNWKGKVFRGTIKRLYFDPNSSCTAC